MKKEITLFVFAEKTELDLDLKENDLIKTLFSFKQLNLSIYKNIVFNKEYALLFCGVGKTNAAFSLTNAVAILEKNDYQIKEIINIGPVGCCDKEIGITKTYLVDKAYFFDVDLQTIPGYKLGQLPDDEYEFQTSVFLNNKIKRIVSLENKNILSADRFFSINDLKKIQDNFSDVALLDMEACALIQCANKLKKDISSIKIVSDNIFFNENYYITKENQWKNQVQKIFLKLLKEI
ncbi:5'-methylthioadenosine nucleosidase [Metamycoplasma alkalescens]|uniref:phosphorylase family protein n=1 Tax=Metamycoplasma alkalescens TaxID=45363 RepID=UPI003D05ADFA